METGRATRAGDYPACLVANENYHHFRAALVRADPQTSRLVLTAAQLDALKCRAGDHVRLVRLCAEERQKYDAMDKQRLDNRSGRTPPQNEPGDAEEVLWQGNDANAAQVAGPVGGACGVSSLGQTAFTATGYREICALLEARKADLTEVIARETGKPRAGGGNGSDGDDQ